MILSTGKLAAYVRTAKRRDEGGEADLYRQRRAILKHAGTLGLSVAKIIEEPADSGVSMERTGLRELLDLIGSGDVAGIIVQDLGRLAREQADFWSLYGKLCGSGNPRPFRLVSVSEDFDTDTLPLWVRKMLDALGSIGKSELEEECRPPEGFEGTKPVHRMAYLGMDVAGVYCPHDNSSSDAFILHFDNQANRPDDLLSVAITVPEAVELRDGLVRWLDDGEGD